MAYSNSPLVVYTKLSPNHSGLRQHEIDTISIHCMAGNLSVEVCGQVFAPTSRKASSNYGIGSDGRVGMYVEEKNGEYYYFNNFIPNPFIYNQYFAYPDAGGSSKMFYMNGCKMCKSGMYGNLFSFHTYEKDQEIPAGKALKLEYYYTFEQ